MTVFSVPGSPGRLSLHPYRLKPSVQSTFFGEIKNENIVSGGFTSEYAESSLLRVDIDCVKPPPEMRYL